MSSFHLKFACFPCCVIGVAHYLQTLNPPPPLPMSFMQTIPTSEWDPQEVETMLSEAFVLSTLHQGSQAHLTYVENQHQQQELGRYLYLQ